MKKKSTELTEKEKQNLIDYCYGRYCSVCAYEEQCIEIRYSLINSIKRNELFEINLLPEHIEYNINRDSVISTLL